MKILQGLICACIVLGMAVAVPAAEPMQYGIAVEGAYFMPSGEMANRFDGVPQGKVGVYYHWKDRVRIQWTGEYCTFDKAWNSTGLSASTNVKQELTLMGLVWNWQYLLSQSQNTPYLQWGAGLYYADFTRGAYQGVTLDETTGLYDSWPALSKDEWTMSVNAGLGYMFSAGPSMQIYGHALYNFIFTEIWPTMILGMESVESINGLNFGVGLRYLF